MDGNMQAELHCSSWQKRIYLQKKLWSLNLVLCPLVPLYSQPWKRKKPSLKQSPSSQRVLARVPYILAFFRELQVWSTCTAYMATCHT